MTRCRRRFTSIQFATRRAAMTSARSSIDWRRTEFRLLAFWLTELFLQASLGRSTHATASIPGLPAWRGTPIEGIESLRTYCTRRTVMQLDANIRRPPILTRRRARVLASRRWKGLYGLLSSLLTTWNLTPGMSAGSVKSAKENQRDELREQTGPAAAERSERTAAQPYDDGQVRSGLGPYRTSLFLNEPGNDALDAAQ